MCMCNDHELITQSLAFCTHFVQSLNYFLRHESLGRIGEVRILPLSAAHVSCSTM